VLPPVSERTPHEAILRPASGVGVCHVTKGPQIWDEFNSNGQNRFLSERERICAFPAKGWPALGVAINDR
jgi:hypothetical protein